jgi:hypothetical protein
VLLVFYELFALSHTAADLQARNAHLERAASLGAAVAALRLRAKQYASKPSTDMARTDLTPVTPAVPAIPGHAVTSVTSTNAAVCLAAS